MLLYNPEIGHAANVYAIFEDANRAVSIAKADLDGQAATWQDAEQSRHEEHRLLVETQKVEEELSLEGYRRFIEAQQAEAQLLRDAISRRTQEQQAKRDEHSFAIGSFALTAAEARAAITDVAKELETANLDMQSAIAVHGSLTTQAVDATTEIVILETNIAIKKDEKLLVETESAQVYADIQARKLKSRANDEWLSAPAYDDDAELTRQLEHFHNNAAAEQAELSKQEQYSQKLGSLWTVLNGKGFEFTAKLNATTNILEQINVAIAESAQRIIDLRTVIGTIEQRATGLQLPESEAAAKNAAPSEDEIIETAAPAEEPIVKPAERRLTGVSRSFEVPYDKAYSVYNRDGSTTVVLKRQCV